MSALLPPKDRPRRIVLDGRYVRLEPIGPQHVADLYRVSNSAEERQRFQYLLNGPPESEADLAAWVAGVSGRDDPVMLAVIDKASGMTEGRQALMRIVPEHGVVEIGHIYWGTRMARTRLATEALFLCARYVFDELGYRRLEWKCNDRNAGSKAAAKRFGFHYEGLFRQHMIVKGENRDTAWFSLVDGEWHRLRAEYERWLAPANFDADGVQATPLRFG